MTNLHTLPYLHAGAAIKDTRAAMILIHGRGASAENILSLSDEWPMSDWAFLAPQADHSVWYPQRFMMPIEQNEPWLGAALTRISTIIDELRDAGIPSERVVLLGFSQGACLALDYAIRNPRRYGGVVGLSGGLIGPPGTSWGVGGDLAQTPVFLGCGDRDAHIPVSRVVESANAFQDHQAAVTARIYPGMDHTINNDEIAWVRELMQTLG